MAKESGNLKIGHYELPKLKWKEEEKKKNQNIQELWDNFRRCSIYIIGIYEGETEEENGTEKNI